MIIDFKNYWDDGRGPDLVRYAVLTCAAAFLEWLLQLRIIFFSDIDQEPIFPSLSYSDTLGSWG